MPDGSAGNPEGIVKISPGLSRLLPPARLPWENRFNVIRNLNEVVAFRCSRTIEMTSDGHIFSHFPSSAPRSVRNDQPQVHACAEISRKVT